MNTSQLSNYAPKARKAFIAAVSAQAAKLGITAKAIAEAHVQGDVLMVGGQAFPKAIASARSRKRDAAWPERWGGVRPPTCFR